MQAKIKEIKNKLSVFLSFNRQYFQWKKIHPSKIDIKNDNLLIVPCDPWAIGGSRGDEAMLIAIIQWYRKKYPKSHIFIISASKEGCDYINNLPYSEITALYEWCGTNPIDRIYKTAINIDINSVILLGADCMDGFYSPFVSLTLIALHELFSLTGNIKSRLMGFSFNNSPYRPICKAFDSLSSDVCINLRDPISLQRFKKQIRINAGLVADVAFLLTPDYDFDGYKRLQEWTTLRHQAQGQYVIGFNFHPMLRKYGDVNGIRKDALAMAEILAEILRRNKNIHFVIIPHDNRNKLTDNIMLGTISNELSRMGLSERFYYDPLVYRASQIKALCGLIDGLVSSRMHLAIAALGQGKSVMAATYQGKFEGLFRHFDLPEDYLLPPDDFISPHMVECFFNYINHLPQLTMQVKNKLNHVIELSNKNFA